MLTEGQAHESSDNLRAHTNYSWAPRTIRVPPMVMRHATALNVALQALYPWDSSVDYPGRIKGMLALFHTRVSKWAIREWRRGRNPTPQWALDLVLAELHKRRSALDHAIALIEAHNKKPAD